MSVAQLLEPLVVDVLGADLAVEVVGWDGSRFGPRSAPARLELVNRRALRRLLWAPNELGLARAYVAGDLLIHGDLLAGLAALNAMRVYGLRVSGRQRRTLLAVLARLGALGPPPRVPPEEARLSGSRHSKVRDAEAISHHYDVGNEFYRLVLGESMTYSCAFWARDSFDLDEAQFAKCDLVARKLSLGPGRRVLDVGCGWGTFAVHAARAYGAHVVGITVSHEQAAFARKRIAEQGVAELVEIRVQDYRDVDDGPYDAISSIGMAEHVGAGMLPTYAACLFRLLRPTGRLLNHAIARHTGVHDHFDPRSFIDRYVFPDGEIVPIATMLGVLEGAGFEVRDVESLRDHYGPTLRAWVANLEAGRGDAVRLTSPARARIWLLYMAGSALAFEANRIGVNQVLAIRPDGRGGSGMDRTREHFTRGYA